MAGKIIVSIVLVIIVVVLLVVLVWGIGAWGFVNTWARNWSPDRWLPDNVSIGDGRSAGSDWSIDLPGLRLGPDRLPSGARQGLEFESPAAGIKRVELDFINEDIEVLPGQGDSIRIEQVSGTAIPQADQMRFGVDGDKLVAQSGRMGNVVGPSSHSTIRLYLPAGGIQAELDTASGNISVKGCALGDLDANAASGDVRMEDVISAGIEADTASGDVLASGVECENFRANTTSGRVDVEGSAAKKFEADTASGDIAYAGNTQSFDANSVSGKVSANIPSGLERFEADTTSGNVLLVCGDAGLLKTIDVDTVSGGVSITMAPSGGFRLEYDTVSGSLKSDFDMRPMGDGEYESGNGGIQIDVDTASGGLTLQKG